MKKTKLLCILHYSPPVHGASKVGDFIKSSDKLKEEFDCKFIKIKSSNTLDDIGKMNFKKIYYVLELFFKILFTIVLFRPEKIYFTASSKGFAFYRDLVICNIWKLYSKFTSCEIYYHYHTKGINSFVKSNRNKKLTRYFINEVNLVLLSPMLKDDFKEIQTYKNIFFLTNGVENNYDGENFEKYISKKDLTKINILYLSNMIKEKGYFEVLKLASKTQDEKIHFHFAGGWQNQDDEKEFFKFIDENKLNDKVTFHGFVNGEQKKELFENSHLLCFPTRYKNEAFPLTILEAFSYGLPVLTTNEGSIPFIVDEKSGQICKNLENLYNSLEYIINNYINITTSHYCRKRFLENFSLEQFEENLIKILRNK